MKTPEQRAEEIDFSDIINFNYPEDLAKGREQIAKAIREHAEETTAELRKIALELLNKYDDQAERVIGEFSGQVEAGLERLRTEVAEWKARIENA